MHLSTHARPRPTPRRVGAVLAAGLAGATVIAAVAPSATAAPRPASGDRELSVAIVGNPQMEDIADLTPDLFTAETGITVDYTVLEEGTLREVFPVREERQDLEVWALLAREWSGLPPRS